MHTLMILTQCQLNLSWFRKIQLMYSIIDSTNTLKLLIRCMLMYKARRLVTQIYNNIHRFEEIKVKARNLVNILIDFKADAHNSKEKLVQVTIIEFTIENWDRCI